MINFVERRLLGKSAFTCTYQPDGEHRKTTSQRISNGSGYVYIK